MSLYDTLTTDQVTRVLIAVERQIIYCHECLTKAENTPSPNSEHMDYWANEFRAYELVKAKILVSL